MKSIKFSFGKILLLFVAMALITSCDEELPDVGSIADETPPEAAFSYSPNEADWKQIWQAHKGKGMVPAWVAPLPRYDNLEHRHGDYYFGHNVPPQGARPRRMDGI